MATGTMTSKGQITVPKEVRESLGLAPGTKVTFRQVGGTWTMSTDRTRAADLVGLVDARGRTASIDDMSADIAAAAAGESPA